MIYATNSVLTVTLYQVIKLLLYCDEKEKHYIPRGLEMRINKQPFLRCCFNLMLYSPASDHVFYRVLYLYLNHPSSLPRLVLLPLEPQCVRICCFFSALLSAYDRLPLKLNNSDNVGIILIAHRERGAQTRMVRTTMVTTWAVVSVYRGCILTSAKLD